MKKLFLAMAILFGCLLFNSANAQVRINLGLNIGNQPEWGPTGYDHADYYYIPDIATYYDVQSHQFIYWYHNQWMRSTWLPKWKREHFDRYRSYKVVINERNPWERNRAYQQRYDRYRGGRERQEIIRDSRDNRYRNHWARDRDEWDKH